MLLERALHPVRGSERPSLLACGGEGAPVVARRLAEGALHRRFGMRTRARCLEVRIRPSSRREGQDEEDQRRSDFQPCAQLRGYFAFLACPGGILACPGGVFDVVVTAAEGGVVTVAGMVFFGPAHGGLPFAVRSICLAAAAFQIFVVGALHLPSFVAVVGVGTVVGTVGGVGVVGVGVVSTGGGGAGDWWRVGVEGVAGCEVLGRATTRAISLGAGG